MFNGARILVAPLDWGLGHAARCIPVVRTLLQYGVDPVIAADGGALGLLRMEFPDLEYVRLPGHPVRYSGGKDQLLTLACQFPAMLRSIRDEATATAHIIKEQRIDAVISDQRFGVRSEKVPSVIITHQLFPRSPMFQGTLQRINLRYIARFDRCWVMDDEASPGLAGELSHGANMPGNCTYIGVQSRFKVSVGGSREKWTTVTVLSGPEPQRTLLEREVLAQLSEIDGPHLLVRGTMTGSSEQFGDVRIVPALASSELEAAMCAARLVIARSGYTTLMDLLHIGAPALLVPTPGQPEQEYLATLNSKMPRWIIQPQIELDIRSAIDRSDIGPSVRSGTSYQLQQALEQLRGLMRTPASLTST